MDEYEITFSKDEYEVFIKPILNAKTDYEKWEAYYRYETLLKVKLREKGLQV